MLLGHCARILNRSHRAFQLPTRAHYLAMLVHQPICGKPDPEDGSKNPESDVLDKQQGTDYSNWVLARSAKFNHEVSFLKRKYGRDRYNIHKLTNMDFMCTLVNR
jgi:hypothetical protein